jgi:CYTH domain-containing protein
MKYERTFMIAPALVRLLQRERLVGRDIIEGYLSRTPEHVHFVRIEPDGCTVLLIANSDGTQTEDRAKVSAAQAKALVDVCQGRVMYRRNAARIGQGLDVYLDQFEGLDLVSVQFEDPAAASAFEMPAWFGPEVTDDATFQRSSFALDGIPVAQEIAATNAAVIAFLDALPGSANGSRFSAFSLADVSRQDVAIELAEEAAAPAPATSAESNEHMDDVLAGLKEALTPNDVVVEKKRSPFLVPVSGRRARG